MSRQDIDSYRERVTRGPNWKKIVAIIFCLLLAVVAAGSFAIYFYGHSLISLANFVSDEDVMQVETLPEAAYEETEAILEGTVVNESELDNIHLQMSKTGSLDTILNKDVYNIVLAGVDRRDKSWNGNADSVMLVSINAEKKRVSIISLMRDTYVNVAGHGYMKLNASYAYGAGPLLAKTIKENFRIDVDRYGAVDFEDMVKIVDALGGVELTLTDEEVEVANGYMMDMCNTMEIPYEEHLLPGWGTYMCDGIQAVAYARNRFVGNSDYSRTQRQRYVISQMVDRIKTLSSAELISFVIKVLPLITHNIPEEEIWDLVGDAPKLLTYSFVTDRVPYDGMYDIITVDSQGMLVPEWDETIRQMQDTIYGDGTVSGNADNDSDFVEEQSTQLTDEYMKMTGGTGVLFPDGYGTSKYSDSEAAVNS